MSYKREYVSHGHWEANLPRDVCVYASNVS